MKDSVFFSYWIKHFYTKCIYQNLGHFLTVLFKSLYPYLILGILFCQSQSGMWKFSTMIVNLSTDPRVVLPISLHLLQGFLKIIYFTFLATLAFLCCAGSSLLWVGFLFFAVMPISLLTAVASLVAEHKLQACRLQQLQLSGSRACAQQFWCTDLVALPHVETSRTRGWTQVPCIGKQILKQLITRGVLF